MRFKEISCQSVRDAVSRVDHGCDCDSCRASYVVYVTARGVRPRAADRYRLPPNDDWMRAASLLYDGMRVVADLGRGRR